MARSLRGALLTLALVLVAGPVYAGGFLESVDYTELLAGTAPPSPIPGQVLVPIVPSRWDPRCLPVQFRVNDTIDPIPHPSGSPILSLADATRSLDKALKTWTDLPTSYIAMRIVGTVSNPGLRAFDFVNEVSFRWPESLAATGLTRWITLLADTTLEDGDDIDGDGDPDVSAAIETCQDVDGDGDIEFPAGFYRAGTILDADVAFNPTAVGFTVSDDEAEIACSVFDDFPSYDLEGIALHEFGHALGLDHSRQDTVMFYSGACYDPVHQLNRRALSPDDAAWASYLYPEGTAGSGPAALQPGDVAFDQRYGLITGALDHGERGRPIVGGYLLALDEDTRTVVTSGLTGTIRLSADQVTGALGGSTILDGRYVLPAPAGRYKVYARPVDDNPTLGLGNFTVQVGAGRQDFQEDFFRRVDGPLELHPGVGTTVQVRAGRETPRIDIVTNRTTTIDNFRVFDVFQGFGDWPGGALFAVRIPAEQFLALAPPGALIHSLSFRIGAYDLSTAARFDDAMLTTGVVNPDSTVTLDLKQPLVHQRDFIGREEGDFVPLYVPTPLLLGLRIRRGIERGEIKNLFLVLRMPQPPFPGYNGFSPTVGLGNCNPPLGLEDGIPPLGYSYISFDGSPTAGPIICDLQFSLVLADTRPSNHLDLDPGTRIRYAPSRPGHFALSVDRGKSLDPKLGPALALPDDGFAAVALTTPFPFQGTSYTEIFVGSDGHVTLGVGDGSNDTRDVVRHVSGPPRLSALLTDLDPTCRGSVHADVRADRVVVTWKEVVHYIRGALDGCGPGVPTNTVQAVLFANGTIDYVFGALDTGIIGRPPFSGDQEAVTGIAAGTYGGPTHEIDMSRPRLRELEAGTIFEQFFSWGSGR